MSRPLVSVIIPTYNRVGLIGRAIESVLCQDLRDLEIIVVDDGSSDDTAKAFGECLDPRLRILRHEANRGAAAARNTGVRAARGEYVAFLDSDDEWLPEKLRIQLAALSRAGGHVAGTTTGFVMDRGSAQRVQTIIPTPHKGLFLRLLWGCDLSPGTTLLCRRSCFDEIGYFDENMHRLEDWDWLLRYARKFELVIVREALAIIHAGDPPPAAPVRAALDVIAERYRREAERLGASATRIFRSSLLVERAAIAFRERQRGMAARLVLESISAYPARNWRFFLRMTLVAFSSLRDRQSASAAPAPKGRGRILHVITSLRSGGAENMLAHLAEHHQAQGCRQCVAVLVEGGINRERLLDGGIPVVDLRVNGVRDIVGGLLRLVQLLRRVKPDVAVGWMYHANLALALALLLSGRRQKTRMIWGLRNSEMEFGRYRLQLRIVARLGSWLSRLPEAVIANSQAGFSFHYRVGYRPKRFYVVDNGVNLARFAPHERLRTEVRRALAIPPEACVAIIVARVDPMKDHATFLDALARTEGIVALAVGSGTESLPDVPSLHKLGERTDIAALLAASDMLILSSAFGEGAPNVVLEAMAAGLAVIATDTGDMRRVVGPTGIVVRPRDVAGMAAAMQRLRDDPALRGRLGDRARARVRQRFSMARAMAAFDLLVDSLEALAFRWSAVPLAPSQTESSEAQGRLGE